MYVIYQVEYGDTLEKIANKTGTTVDNIKNINGLTNDSSLMVGNLIVVPSKKDEIFKTYKIKKGDTLYSIARMYDVDLETLLLLNGLNKDDYLYPNQEILVPSGNVVVYVTRQGDTMGTLANNFNTDSNTLTKENDKIFVMPDQLIVHKRG